MHDSSSEVHVYARYAGELHGMPFRLVPVAREWLTDCFDHDPNFDALDLNYTSVVAAVAKYYDGGTAAFVADFETVGYLGRGL